MNSKKTIYLIDLPTFPKGVISLSFPAIAASLGKEFKIVFVDLNIRSLTKQETTSIKNNSVFFVAIKVSFQNCRYAIELSKKLKTYNPEIKIIWGGEYASLVSTRHLNYVDTRVIGAFEPIANELTEDLKRNKLKKEYNDKRKYNCAGLNQPDYDIITNKADYWLSMGMPVETSRGCDKKCTFCMVHTMQPLNNFKTPRQLKAELAALRGSFINVIDYNLGSDMSHLTNVIQAFRDSEVTGWMAEMCLETLDNDELLLKLAMSKCRIIYCGLESIDSASLLSINKAKTNNISNYMRIIKKAQKHGIQIAAGIIIGLEGASKQSIWDTFKFYESLGVIYAKITFLTYSPGTKVFDSMKRVGSYLTEEPEYFDGNHLTFLPKGVNKEEILSALALCIKRFYSKNGIKQRAQNAQVMGPAYNEFVSFNLMYRLPYFKWLKYNIFENDYGFKQLLSQRFRKTKTIQLIERDISTARHMRLSDE